MGGPTCTVCALAVGATLCAFAPTVRAAPAATPASTPAPTPASDPPPAKTNGKRPRARRTSRHELRIAPWALEHAPVRNMVELGAYAGLLFPSRAHELYDRDVGFTPLRKVFGAFGARLGFLPLRWLGVELEAGLMPGRTGDNDRVLLYNARAHLLFQIPLRIAPFGTIGGGLIGVDSSEDELGDDLDPSWQLGGGLKFYATDLISARLEFRHTFTNHRDEDTVPGIHVELLAGIAFTFGRSGGVSQHRPRNDDPVDGDLDGDGFENGIDACPEAAGVRPDGCPIRDSDGDGFNDRIDVCPKRRGWAPDGCPVPDRDNDGLPDRDDLCPERAGDPPDGCPKGDADNDGITDLDDQCKDQRENRNGFEDGDGCPDEIPVAVSSFTGVIKGIYFAEGKAKLKTSSAPVLEEVARVLVEHPSVKLEIVGHTDSTGGGQHNRVLSQKRAEAVVTFLVEAGVRKGRLIPRGAGEDEPIASNETPMGRAENRRTEFHVVVE